MTNKTDFSVGDEVEHLTGGPRMIYTGESQLGEAICEWFDGRQRHQASFAFVALKKTGSPLEPSIMVI